MTPDDINGRRSDETEDDFEISLSYVIQASSKWVEKLAKHEKQVSKRVKQLCESGQNFKKSHSERSELRKCNEETSVLFTGKKERSKEES